ncbi:MAG: tyrosine--tRNA ligase, partial [Bacillota bacterium]
DPERTTITFNSTWLAPLTFEGVVKLASKVTVARMLERDDFANRYREGRPIFIHEFFYPLMQAYDSVALDADVELGGTDQKFNNLMGRALQREFGQESQCVVLTPILPGLDGVQKMSKSLGNYIGINEPPGEIFGKTMSIPDDLIVPYINCATRLPHQEKVAIERGLASGQLHPMAAKKRLAWQFVAEYHGEEQADAAQVEFERVFSRRQVPDDVPLLTVPASELSDGRIGIVRLMMLGALASSNSEARRLVDQGGVRIDDVKVESSNDLVEVRSGMILKVGKRRFAKVAVE